MHQEIFVVWLADLIRTQILSISSVRWHSASYGLVTASMICMFSKHSTYKLPTDYVCSWQICVVSTITIRKTSTQITWSDAEMSSCASARSREFMADSWMAHWNLFCIVFKHLHCVACIWKQVLVVFEVIPPTCVEISYCTARTWDKYEKSWEYFESTSR